MSKPIPITLDGVSIEVVKTGKRTYETVNPPPTPAETGVTVEFDLPQPDEGVEDLTKRVEELEKQNRITTGLVDALKKETLETARDIGMLRHRDSDYLWPYRVPHRRIVWQVTR